MFLLSIFKFSWSIPSSDVEPTHYEIFRNNALIATVPFEEKNVLKDHNLKKIGFILTLLLQRNSQRPLQLVKTLSLIK